MLELIVELKRRNVFRVGVAYLALAWVIIQITDMAVPALNLPPSLQSIVFYIGVIGFPFAALLAWAFELTPDGIKREHEVDRSQSVTHVTGRKLDFVIIGLMAIALSFVVWDAYLREANVEVITEIAAAAIDPAVVEPTTRFSHFRPSPVVKGVAERPIHGMAFHLSITLYAPAYWICASSCMIRSAGGQRRRSRRASVWIETT